MTRAKVFSETYARYLGEIRQTDYLSKADLLGLTVDHANLIVPLFDMTYRFNGQEFVAPQGEKMSPGVQVMLCKYLLSYMEGVSPADQAGPQWITYREFKGSAPLHSYFDNSTNKALAEAFSGNLLKLQERALEVGGEMVDSPGYDLSMCFQAFPRVPMIVNFNDADEMFPASVSVLYRSNATSYLDLECLAMTGTLLTAKLLGKSSGVD